MFEFNKLKMAENTYDAVLKMIAELNNKITNLEANISSLCNNNTNIPAYLPDRDRSSDSHGRERNGLKIPSDPPIPSDFLEAVKVRTELSNWEQLPRKLNNNINQIFNNIYPHRSEGELREGLNKIRDETKNSIQSLVRSVLGNKVEELVNKLSSSNEYFEFYHNENRHIVVDNIHNIIKKPRRLVEYASHDIIIDIQETCWERMETEIDGNKSEAKLSPRRSVSEESPAQATIKSTSPRRTSGAGQSSQNGRKNVKPAQPSCNQPTSRNQPRRQGGQTSASGVRQWNAPSRPAVSQLTHFVRTDSIHSRDQSTLKERNGVDRSRGSSTINGVVKSRDWIQPKVKSKINRPEFVDFSRINFVES